MSQSARLDRIYMPISDAIRTIFTPHLELVRHWSNGGLYYNAFEQKPDYGPCYRQHGGSLITDHLPVRLTLKQIPVNHSEHRVIPMWIADCPAFIERFMHHWSRNSKGTRSFGLDNLFNQIAIRAAMEVIKLRTTFGNNNSLVAATIGLYKQTQTKIQNEEKILSILTTHPCLASHVYQLEGGRYVEDTLREYLDEMILTYRSNPPTTIPMDCPDYPSKASEPSLRTPLIKRSNYSLAKALKHDLPDCRERLTHLRLSLEDTPTDNPSEKASMVQECYARIWATNTKEPARSQMRAKLANYNTVADGTLITRPTVEQVKEGILHTNNSCAGPNGIPFNVYRRLVDIYAPIALMMFDDLAAGGHAPAGFNTGLLFLLPKGSSMLVNDTRPLSVTNTNNRIIAHLTARAIEPAVAKLVGESQLGFIRGRIVDDHIIGVTDKYYKDLETKTKGYLLFLDVKKAFDQVHHTWIFEVLRKQAFPPWLLSMTQGLLQNVQVTPVCGQAERIWIDILRGVKQGCPLSPLLFILALDPVIKAIEKIPSVKVFAYADDMANAYPKLTDTKLIAQTVNGFEPFTGLAINGSKSGVLASTPPTIQEKHYLHSLNLWPTTPPSPSTPGYAVKILEWALDDKRLSFVDRYQYLGILLGSNISLDDIFADTVDKAINRIDRYTRIMSRMPLYRKIRVINIFVNSLFSYKFRFYTLPLDLYRKIKEKIRLALTHLGGGAFGYTALLFPPKNLGLSHVLKDLSAYNTALLASRSDIIHIPATPYMSLKTTILFSHSGDNLNILTHRDAAAVDTFEFSRTLTPLLASSETIPHTNTTSPYLTKLMTAGIFGDEHENYTHLTTSRRLLHSLYSTANDDATKLILFNLNSINSKMPTPVSLHQLYLHCNSLVTSRRMRHSLSKPLHCQDPTRRCYICNLPNSEDSLEHLYACKLVCEARSKFLQTSNLPTKLQLPSSCTADFHPHQRHTMASRYLTHLCFAISSPDKQANMALHIACFNWAVWQGRNWSVHRGMPHPNFVNKVITLAGTMCGPSWKIIRAKARKARLAAAAAYSTTLSLNNWLQKSPLTTRPNTTTSAPHLPLSPTDLGLGIPDTHIYDFG